MNIFIKINTQMHIMDIERHLSISQAQFPISTRRWKFSWGSKLRSSLRGYRTQQKKTPQKWPMSHSLHTLIQHRFLVMFCYLFIKLMNVSHLSAGNPPPGIPVQSLEQQAQCSSSQQTLQEMPSQEVWTAGSHTTGAEQKHYSIIHYCQVIETELNAYCLQWLLLSTFS